MSDQLPQATPCLSKKPPSPTSGRLRDCGSAGAERPLHEARPLYDSITELRRKDPRAGIPETSFPEPYLLSETENTIINDILDLLNKHGLTSHQSLNLLERLGRIIEMGQRVE
jgi:hypothetical protein